MAEQLRGNPSINQTLGALTTYSFSATSTGGSITGTGLNALARAQSILLSISGGTAQGFTTLAEYFVIPVNTTTIYLASTPKNALDSVPITTTGNAGGGTIYPNYKIAGGLYVGTGGDINIRGYCNGGTGVTSFSVHKNVADGSMIPFMVDSISAYLTTAQDFVVWVE
jgi:hypothetical protein